MFRGPSTFSVSLALHVCHRTENRFTVWIEFAGIRNQAQSSSQPTGSLAMQHENKCYIILVSMTRRSRKNIRFLCFSSRNFNIDNVQKKKQQRRFRFLFWSFSFDGSFSVFQKLSNSAGKSSLGACVNGFSSYLS